MPNAAKNFWPSVCASTGAAAGGCVPSADMVVTAAESTTAAAASSDFLVVSTSTACASVVTAISVVASLVVSVVASTVVCTTSAFSLICFISLITVASTSPELENFICASVNGSIPCGHTAIPRSAHLRTTVNGPAI